MLRQQTSSSDKKIINVLFLTTNLPDWEKAGEPEQVLMEIKELKKIKKIRVRVLTDNNIPSNNLNILSLNKYKLNIFNYYKVIMVLICAKKTMPRSIRKDHWLYWFKGILENLKIIQFIEDEGIDILHSHWFFPRCTAGVYASILKKIPLIVSSRGVDLLIDKKSGYGWRQSKERSRILNFVINKAKYITVASSATKKEAYKMVKNKNIIKMIPNGIDLNRFKNIKVNPKIKQKLLGGNKYLLLSVGKLSRNKGHDVLIKTILLLKTNGMMVKLLIIGNGEEYSNIERLIKRYNLDDQVVLLGKLSFVKLIKYYYYADCFCLLSRVEGFGNVYLEALASECPIIATSVGFINDYITDGVHARIVKNNDIYQTAHVIKEVLLNKKNTENMKKNGRKLAREMFSIKNKIDKYIDLYYKAHG